MFKTQFISSKCFQVARITFIFQDFENDLRAIEPRVDEVRNAFRELAAKTPALQSRHDAVMESWNNLWSISNLYIDR